MYYGYKNLILVPGGANIVIEDSDYAATEKSDDHDDETDEKVEVTIDKEDLGI